jgi:predicted ATPase
MVTVLGPAGIGKSRLAKELAAAVDQRATVLVGRCLPYGEGITYWPLVEIVRRLTGLPDEAAIAALAGHGQEARRIATRIARLVAIEPGGVAADEAHWAVRRLLEIRATRHPVIVVVDDIHWAEPSLLELLEHVWTFAADVPLLGICLARPDLLERRPGWGERDGAGVMTLGPLAAGDAAALLGTLTEGRGVDADEAARVLTAAEGNPFFLEQMVAMRAEGEGAAAGIPATIQALLAARIDALPAPERAALGSAAVEGRHFHRGAVAEMLPAEERERLDASLAALVRRQLIRPGGAELPGESGFRFAHILVRDVAYELLTKAARADLHQRYAAWLKRRAGTGFAEIVGYHLEKAHRCHAELRPGAEAERAAIGIEAAHHLGGAGRLALGRGDLPAGVNLLERATAVLAADDPERGRLMPDLGMALAQLGRLPHAEEVLVAAARSAALRGARSAEAHALTARFFARVQTDSEAAAADLRRQFDGLRRTFDADGDDLGLARLWRADGLVHWLEGRSADAEVAWMRAVRHARRAGDEHARADALVWIASAARDGPTPVEPAIARCNAIMEQLQADRRSQGLTLRPLAALHAMCGRFAEARALLDRATETFSELGVSMHAAISEDEALVALLCGDAAAAEAALRLSYVHLEQMGERALLANTAGLLAHALCAQGRDADALAFTDVAQAAAAADDLAAQILYRTVRARVLAGRADLAAADRLSSEAVALAERTDWLNDHADALMARAAVLCPMDRQGEAREAIGTAIALYERKGNVVALARARETLEGAVVV